MAIADLFRRISRPSATNPDAMRWQHEAEKEAAAEKRREAAESRRESERRWYARLPIMAIATLCVAVAALTGLLVFASRYASPPEKQDSSKQPPPATDAPASAPPKTPIKSSFNGKKLFDYNSSNLRVADSAVQQELDRCLSLNLSGIHVVGHTDCIGSDAYNQDLSKRRAEAVKRYLAEKGVDAALITATGLGPELSKADPLCTGVVRATASNIARLERYRRVDITCDYEELVS